jgi:hypothetical protein
MKLLSRLVATLGRLVLPQVDADPGTPLAGELWILSEDGEDDKAKFRNNADDATLRLLTDADLGVPNGVASLGSDGLVTSDQLPSTFGAFFSMPIGGMFDWPGPPETVPEACLVCDGSEYLRSEYPDLFALLRCKFGRPSTDEYFRVPDKIGRVAYGAWSYPNSGLVRRVDVVSRGQGYTPGTYAFTFTGGTFSTAATGLVTVVTETVPGVGATGVIDSVTIVTPGLYTSLGTATAGTAENCALVIPGAALPGGTGVEYDIFAQPIAGVRPPYAWSIHITDHGTGYTTPPEVSFTGGTLKGATAYAVIRDGGVAEVIVSCPGYGPLTSVTVVFTGGDGSGAAAEVYADQAYLLPGEYAGSEAHPPLESELPAHIHSFTLEPGTGVGNGAGFESSVNGAGDTGDDYPMPMRPAGVGLIPLIRAV